MTAADGIGTALARVAAGDVEALRAALADARAHRGIHEARKAIRRLRSVLLLGRKPFEREGATIDAALKTLAMSLSALRDAHVACETASAVRRRIDATAERARWATLRRQLARRRDALLRAERDADPGFGSRLSQLATLADAISALPWDRLDTRTVRKGLARSVRRVERAGAVALAPRATLEERHRWRRRLRRLRMQWSALRTVRKAGTTSDARTLLAWLRAHAQGPATVSQAADALGREQDLRLLQLALRRLPAAPETQAALATLRTLRGAVARKRPRQ